MQRRTVLIVTIVVAAIAILVASVAFSGPSILWTPDKLATSIAPGGHREVVATATIQKAIGPTNVWLTPSLSPYATVTPATLPALEAGKVVQFHIVFTLPSSAPAVPLGGTLHLRGVPSSNGSGRQAQRSRNATIAKPLEIQLLVGPVVETVSGVNIVMPTDASLAGGQVQDPIVTSGGPGVTYVDIQVSMGASEPEGTFGFVIIDNPSLESLTDWFANNIDSPDQLLRTEGTFALQPHPAGGEMFVGSGEVPGSSGLALLPHAVVMSPARTKVVTATLSDENYLFELGYTTRSQREALLMSLVNSLTFQE